MQEERPRKPVTGLYISFEVIPPFHAPPITTTTPIAVVVKRVFPRPIPVAT